MLSEMFQEGTVLLSTDLNEIIDIQNSNKFNISTIKVGDNIEEITSMSEELNTIAQKL